MTQRYFFFVYKSLEVQRKCLNITHETWHAFCVRYTLPHVALKGEFMLKGFNEKQRLIQEYVPGKQVTLAHVIAHPVKSIYEKLGLTETGAIGILTLTPGETVIIAADVATKAAEIEIGFLDRFTGALVITGDVASVETALNEVNTFLENNLNYSPAKLSRS